MKDIYRASVPSPRDDEFISLQHTVFRLNGIVEIVVNKNVKIIKRLRNICVV